MPTPMSPWEKEQLRLKVAWHADQISKLFKNPMVTVIVRALDIPDCEGDLIVTEDDLARIRETVDHVDAWERKMWDERYQKEREWERQSLAAADVPQVPPAFPVGERGE